MLLGLWVEGKNPPIVVAHDAQKRMGKHTRVSLFVTVDALLAAAKNGWASYENEHGERIVAFPPFLLPVYAEMLAGGDTIGEDEVVPIIDSADALTDQAGGVERVRRATSTLVRDRTFRRKVVEAYSRKCAMCGLGLGLVQGAHILPASAPLSRDVVSNGIALCPNHHAAYDRHLLFVEPGTLRLFKHPSLEPDEGPSDTFLAIYETLEAPRSRHLRPSDDMLHARTLHFNGAYNWARPKPNARPKRT